MACTLTSEPEELLHVCLVQGKNVMSHDLTVYKVTISSVMTKSWPSGYKPRKLETG